MKLTAVLHGLSPSTERGIIEQLLKRIDDTYSSLRVFTNKAGVSTGILSFESMLARNAFVDKFRFSERALKK